VKEDGWNPNDQEVVGGFNQTFNAANRPTIGTAGHGDPQSVHIGDMNKALDKWLAKRGLLGEGKWNRKKKRDK